MKAKPIDLSIVTAAQRAAFERQIDRSGDGCWPWTGGRDEKGYGRFKIGEKRNGTLLNTRAHRIAFKFAHPRTKLGPDDCILHKCDFPPCCRPDHLFKGTNADNNADKMEKGRYRHTSCPGEANGCAKLTELEVKAILRSKEPFPILAKRYRVDAATLCDIQRGRTWTHIPGERRESKSQGSKHCNAKLTEAKVRKIRASDDTLEILAGRYGVSIGTISRVNLRQSWAHVT